MLGIWLASKALTPINLTLNLASVGLCACEILPAEQRRHQNRMAEAGHWEELRYPLQQAHDQRLKIRGLLYFPTL